MTNIALTPLSTYLCPDWSIRRPMELPGERFHGTFCTSPSHCLHFCFIILSCFQGSAYVLLSLPKTDSKMGVWIYGRPFKEKVAEIPMRKSDILTLAFLLNQGEKNQSIFLEKTQILLCEWESQDSLWKYICKERPPTEAKVVQCRKKKHE